MSPKKAHLNIRDIPRETLAQIKMVAVVEQRSLKDLVLDLLQKKITEMEQRGEIPNRKMLRAAEELPE